MTRKEEIFLILMEECAEVAQQASKCIRFGGGQNHYELAKEIGDIMCMIDLLYEDGIITHSDVRAACGNKREKLKKFSNIFEEEWEENNERMDIIGQNGNDGLHYSEV